MVATTNIINEIDEAKISKCNLFYVTQGRNDVKRVRGAEYPYKLSHFLSLEI